MRRLTTAFFLASCIVAALINIILEARAWHIGTIYGWQEYVTAKALQVPLHLYVFIILLIFLYQAWSIIDYRDSICTATIRPTTAVRLMFIPIFNLYWLFHAVGDFPRQFNSFLRCRRPRTYPLSQSLFVSWCIIAVIGGFSVAAFAALEYTAGSLPVVTGAASCLRLLSLYAMGTCMASGLWFRVVHVTCPSSADGALTITSAADGQYADT